MITQRGCPWFHSWSGRAGIQTYRVCALKHRAILPLDVQIFIENGYDAWLWGCSGEQDSINSLNLKSTKENNSNKTNIINPVMLKSKGHLIYIFNYTRCLTYTHVHMHKRFSCFCYVLFCFLNKRAFLPTINGCILPERA